MTDAYTHEPLATDADVGFLVPKSDASFRFMLRSGFVGEVTVAGTSFNRLYGGVQDADGRNTFLMFNSRACRVAINRRHLAAVQFRADASGDCRASISMLRTLWSWSSQAEPNR